MELTELFSSMVFSDDEMRKYLPKETYRALIRTVKNGRHLDLALANVVAHGMKEWAIAHGATHFTHWFQPMTGITAEKHDSFLTGDDDGHGIMEFSGKELVRGEPDASSFPSGGLRATFEARGYTAWDATSYAFIKDNTLCIPTAFCSYGGEALDKKTPLLRSMEALNRQAMRVLRLFGNEDVTSVRATVGAEQEYFLIDKKDYDRRPDLIYTGRTLFGARPPKGQELGDHYFGAIKPRVKEFMDEVDRELWALGVRAKTEHNEAAPAQHELAPVYTSTNIATDQNQLTMEILQKVAKRHGMVCLLHEKPFAGVNGSGKHNNWSLSTDTGVNLLEPGDTPAENAQFLLLLCAVIKAVDEHQDLLRVSAASAGNDHRLGANEAPPAIVSLYLGDELSAILEAIEKDKVYDVKEAEPLRIGVHTLPKFPKDNTDRNRTSPFAFTGNKFEFRMVGASASIASANIVINTSVADALASFADTLEGADDFESALHDLIRTCIRDHKRILFNGNGYHDSWQTEAVRRGLSNLRSTPDALPCLITEENIAFFERNKVFSRAELLARYDILTENYVNLVNIEALSMIDMVRRDILPAVSRFSGKLAENANAKRAFSSDVCVDYETSLIAKLANRTASVCRLLDELEDEICAAHALSDVTERANAYRENVIPRMNEIRVSVDDMETVTDRSYWPYPSYGDILFGVR